MRWFNNPWVVLGIAWLTLSSCSALEPRADPSRFFTLTPLSTFDQNRPQGRSDAPGVPIGIGPLKIPGYLDREQIVTRVSANRYQVAENDRWAEPIEENIQRVIVQNLTGLMPSAEFVDYPWRANERPKYQVQIELLRFEANGAASAECIARWSVRDTATKKVLAGKESRLSQSVNPSSTDAAVAALSAALGEFSRELAQALLALEAKSKT